MLCQLSYRGSALQARDITIDPSLGSMQNEVHEHASALVMTQFSTALPPSFEILGMFQDQLFGFGVAQVGLPHGHGRPQD